MRLRIAWFVLLGGCVGGHPFGTPDHLSVEVALRVEACDPALDPFQGVTFLGTRLSGQAESITTVSDPVASVTVVAPIASGLTVEVRGYHGDPGSGGTLVSRGVSAPFEVQVIDGGAVAPAVQVFFRKAGVFTPAFSIANGGGCSQALLGARAGHTATRLADGTVFIAGGYDLTAGTSEPEALFTTEAFDPAIDAFVSRNELAIASGVQRLPRARASSTLLQTGQVLLWAGEIYDLQGVVSPSAIILVYDRPDDAFGALPSRIAPQSIPRTRHQSASDSAGRVVIAGGITREQNSGAMVPAEAVEWFDPMTNKTFVVNGVSLARDGASVAALQGGQVIAVAGGSDGGAVANDVALLSWNGTDFARSSTSPAIAPRRDAASAVAGGRLLLAGGFSDPAGTVALGTTELVDTVSGQSVAGPAIAPRGGACAVALDDSNVLIAGGQNGTAVSSAAELMHVDAAGAMSVTALPPLPVARFDHTCTLLADGTVLIAGGANEQGVLQDAYVFEP